MSESSQHQKLVSLIIEDVMKMVGKDYYCFVETDIADEHPIPQLTPEGFRPDVMYQYGNMMIIGEAKTGSDVEREHSIMQYESYMRKCSLFDGDAMFVVAVPWIEYATVYNITKKIKRKYPGEYVVKILKGIGI